MKTVGVSWVIKTARLLTMLGLAGALRVAAGDIPELNWTPRSDWLNVKTGVSPAAVGDGVADDTAALQAALNQFTGSGAGPKVVYVPPGTYRITSTLQWPNATGCALIGHGRDTEIAWHGAAGPAMLWSTGASRCDVIGISWNGRGLAGIGVEHFATNQFEASNRHLHSAFRNLGIGIRGGRSNQTVYASSEMEIRNCLFTNCTTGVQFTYFNYYNELITGCEFRQCGTGVDIWQGHGYVRNSHFRGSTSTDLAIGGVHRCGVARCTSVASRMFWSNLRDDIGPIPPIMQDCHVAHWTNPSGAVVSNRDGWFIFDCTFTNPPSTAAPINIGTVFSPARNVLYANCRSPQTTGLFRDAASATEIPPGARGGSGLTATQSFLQTSVAVPTVVFDAVRDFGAGSGTDETAAVQATINAAAAYGQGALAYFPPRTYRISQTIQVTGTNYVVGGAGYYSVFQWKGASGGAIFQVHHADRVRVEYLAALKNQIPVGCAAIRVTGPVPGELEFDRLFLVSGERTLGPQPREGLHLLDLPAGTVVRLGKIMGQLRLTNCRAARVLCDFWDGIGLTVEGNGGLRTGFFGISTANAANITVAGNEDLVIGDYYTEQSSGYGSIGPLMNNLWVGGGVPGETGRVTIAGSKTHMVDSPDLVRASNYCGTVSYIRPGLGYLSNTANTNHIYNYRIRHQGDAPLTLLFAHGQWEKSPAAWELGPNAQAVRLRNADLSTLPQEWGGPGPVWIPSPVAATTNGPGYAVQFNGTNDFLMGPNEDLYRGSATSLTVVAWVRCDTNVAGRAVSFGNITRTSGHAWYLEAGPTARFVVADSAGQAGVSSGASTSTLAVGEWYLLAGTWDNTNVAVYVNGRLEKSAAAKFSDAQLAANDAYRLYIGGGTPYFRGAVDELRLYRRVLTTNELAAIYNAGQGEYGAPTDTGLISGWHFDEGTGLFSADYKRRSDTIMYRANTDRNPTNAWQLLGFALDHFRELGALDLLFYYGLGADAPVDSVGDGIPDWWRAQYFGGDGTTTNARSCAACDASGTGQNNLFKYIAGLDPTNAAAVFRLQLNFVAGQPNLRYEPLAAGRVYTPEFRTNLLAGSWQPLPGYVGPVTNGNAAFIVDPAADVEQKFYRLSITWPDGGNP